MRRARSALRKRGKFVMSSMDMTVGCQPPQATEPAVRGDRTSLGRSTTAGWLASRRCLNVPVSLVPPVAISPAGNGPMVRWSMTHQPASSTRSTSHGRCVKRSARSRRPTSSGSKSSTGVGRRLA